MNATANEYALVRRLCRERFYDFVQEFWETIIEETPVWNWHLEYLCDELQEVAERVFRGEEKEYDLVINIPPGTTKSTICSIMFTPWVWTRMPSARSINGSYADRLALDFSRKSRDIVQSEKYQACFPGVVLRADQNTKGYYANDRKGMRYSVGTGGSVIGMHAHFLIADDPIDPKAALSEAELLATNNWMFETLSQRKVDKRITPLILVMQRLAQLDPSGSLLKQRSKNGVLDGTLRHICLPAEAEDDVKPAELREKYVDGLLDPLRLSKKVLAEARKTLLEVGYSGQYRQNPIPRGGLMFDTSKLTIEKCPSKFKRLVRYWDKAATKNAGARSAGVLLGVDMDDRICVVDVQKGQWAIDERNRIIVRTARVDALRKCVLPSKPGLHQRLCITVTEQEPGSGGKESAVYTVKKLAGYRVRTDRPQGDKTTRANPFADQVNEGNVYLAEGEWNAEYLEELGYFNKGQFRDQVDASSGAFAHLSGKKRIAGTLC